MAADDLTEGAMVSIARILTQWFQDLGNANDVINNIKWFFIRENM